MYKPETALSETEEESSMLEMDAISMLTPIPHSVFFSSLDFYNIHHTHNSYAKKTPNSPNCLKLHAMTWL